MSLKQIGVNLFILKLLLAVFAVPCMAQKDEVHFKAEPALFEMPLSVKEVTFSFDQLPAHPKAEEVSAAQVIGRVTPYSDLPEAVKASREQIQFRSGAFIQLLIEYRAIRMERGFRNKFFDPRSKGSSAAEVNWTLARNFAIQFPDSTLARKFVEEAKRRQIEGLVNPSQGWGPEDVHLHGFDIPPNDTRWNDNATGFQHWHLFRGEAYGTETEVAWSMTPMNRGDDETTQVGRYR
jgi:hypothetical protein